MPIFFRDNQEQRDYLNSQLNKQYPGFKTGGYFFREYLKKHLANNNSIILDAGCGDGGIIAEFKAIPKLIIGVDINQKLLEQNQIINQKIIADLENIPLADNSINIAISQFVIEHLRHPALVFREISRVLKPGGAFIFLTPNVINPIMSFSKISPANLHSFLRTAVLKKIEKTHPTYYRANTYRKLFKLGKSAGFDNCGISRAGNPEYLGFCRPLAPLAISWEKLIDNKYLNFLKMYLIGCFTKK